MRPISSSRVELVASVWLEDERCILVGDCAEARGECCCFFGDCVRSY